MVVYKLPETRKGLLAHLRKMQGVIKDQVSTWNVPALVEETVEDGAVIKRPRKDEEHPEWHAANWELLQQRAVRLKSLADGLYIFAVQQGRLARERAHPANQATAPELEQP